MAEDDRYFLAALEVAAEVWIRDATPTGKDAVLYNVLQRWLATRGKGPLYYRPPMDLPRATLGELAAQYLFEPINRLNAEWRYDVLAIIAPPPNPEGAAVVVTTAKLERIIPILQQAIVSHCRQLGRKVRVLIEDD